LSNQHEEVVQQGEVDMMLDMREPGSLASKEAGLQQFK
jgi:hypothetical protein